MNYKGQELEEFDTTTRHVFDPPRTMLVWDDNYSEPEEAEVFAILPNRGTGFQVIASHNAFGHCAEIPETKLATYRELARWLAEGKGQFRRFTDARLAISYDPSMDNDSVPENSRVRKWSDTEWHSPAREYLGLED